MNAVSPALASVLVVSIADFARRPVSEQARLKTRAEDLVAQALEPLPPARRVMLDAPQGVAVAILDAPRLALELAERLPAGTDELPLCIAINHGPVTILEDATGGRGLVGDGITTAMTLAEVAKPDRMVASRAFREALLADAPGRAARLKPTGRHTDAQVRTHELYTLKRWAAWTRRLRLTAVGVVAIAGIVGLGIAARAMLQVKPPPPAPAVIELQISPRGDIYVDGVLKGQSPPLTRLEIASGPHMIQILNEPHAPLTVDINPAPAEVTTIAHAFPLRTPEQATRERAAKQQAREEAARERAARERAAKQKAREEAARERARRQREASERQAKEQASKSWNKKLQDDVRKGVRDSWRDLRRGVGF